MIKDFIDNLKSHLLAANSLRCQHRLLSRNHAIVIDMRRSWSLGLMETSIADGGFSMFRLYPILDVSGYNPPVRNQ